MRIVIEFFDGRVIVLDGYAVLALAALAAVLFTNVMHLAARCVAR